MLTRVRRPSSVVRPSSFVVRQLILLLGLCLTSGGVALAQDSDQLAPPEVPGEVVYIPFPVKITLDGALTDWKGVPTITVEKGPTPSSDPAENGSFTFAVAADAENFYITMSMPDQKIIAGKHGTDFWNEDSFEFFLNTSGDLAATTYTDAISQVNINATNIGNTDAAITVTGVNGDKLDVRALVFSTDTGWGFEAAMPLPSRIKLAHGLEIGFQAQINGASELDRDVKLIWSNADTSDNSWNNPSLFGRAIFFEVGQTEIPQPSLVEIQPTPTLTPEPLAVSRVSLNQTGYYPNAKKRAVVASESDSPLEWSLKDSSGNVVLTGQTLVKGADRASGDNVHQIDFSAYTTPGTGYVLEVVGVKSFPFDISTSIYSELKRQALAYFYHNRSGIPIEAQYAGGEQWARRAGHLSDNDVTCYKGVDTSGKSWPGCDYRLDVSGGWYDAGDFGKYVVNGGISVWTLMNEYERNPSTFGDGMLAIPENKNGVPDILDEARWEMNFMLGMQVPSGQPQAGMAHHKMHDRKWAGMPVLVPETVNNDAGDSGRYLYMPTTAATLNLAATAAQCARLWKTIDADFSARCLTAAETAWTAAQANPRIFAAAVPGEGGGDYGDNDVQDEFYWAAAELYVTTGKDVYKDYLLASSHFARSADLYWGNTDALGTISLALVPSGLPAEKLSAVKDSLIAQADQALSTLENEGYLVPIPSGYPWGSNSSVLNRMLIMGYAYDFTSDQKYLDGLTESMDYLLGRNPLNKSYVSGYGDDPLQHPHHRFWGNDPARGFPPPPPGVIAGGPNSDPNDPTAQTAGLKGCSSSRCYIDAIGSWTTNEVTINWNAPLAWSVAFIDQKNNLAATPIETPTTSAPSPLGTPNTNTSSLPIYWLIAGGVIILLAGLGFWLWRRRARG
jgi:endoglucanase